MAHVAKWKQDRVKNLTDVLVNNQVIGIVDITGIPASQLQQIRKNLPSGSTFIVTKNTLLKLALKKASSKKDNIDNLIDSLEGQVGVITADVNPFRLFRKMEMTKIKAPARGGEAAPEDIEIKEGETSFKPGPIVGELQKAGFPAAIERGKVVIKSDKTIVKKGERISSDVAKMLTKLEIYPMTVGLNLLAGHENGMVFARDVLDVDVEGYLNSIKNASSSAFNLAMFVSYPTEATTKTMIINAHQNALNLALFAEIPTSETIKILISKAQNQMLSLASLIPETPEEKKEEDQKGEESQEKKEEKAPE
jgi:large subunit ribosomal protein L10